MDFLALAPTAVRDCPHCDRPVAVVARPATPEADRPVIAHRPGSRFARFDRRRN